MRSYQSALLIMLFACSTSWSVNAREAQVTTSSLGVVETEKGVQEEVHPLPEDVLAPTMKEIAKHQGGAANTPQEALDLLKSGNANFFSGKGASHQESANFRRAQIMTQTPFAVVLGCSDSRVPIEIVFDQGLGAIFSIRVAGNITDQATLGSIEYAVEHLDSKILVVMGHEGCGAVGAAMLPEADQQKEAENVRYLLDAVKPSLKAMPKIRDKKARMREAVIANVRWQVAKLKKNPIVAASIASGEVHLVGAFYEISSGAVDFLETEEELALDPAVTE